MAEYDQDQRTEEPTAKQIEQFREKGDVAKSRDIASLVTLAAGMGGIVIAWPIISSNILRVSTGIFGRLEVTDRGAFLASSFGTALVGIIAPVVIPIVVFGIAAQLLQVGWHPTLKPLAFNLTKLNPLPRFKQLFFSTTTVLELLKSIVKMGIIGSLAIYVLKSEIVDNGRLVGLVPIEVLRRIGTMALRILLYVGIAFAFIAILDLIIERYRHKRKMMMTKDQVKQEHKNREGDPLVKKRVRKKQYELVRGRMLAAVQGADVVVVNPTHFSVALRYKLDEDAAPIILAMGKDAFAAKIRDRARKNNIPIVSDPPLARGLYAKGQVGGYIPADFYQAVASLLAWVLRATGKVAS